MSDIAERLLARLDEIANDAQAAQDEILKAKQDPNFEGVDYGDLPAWWKHAAENQRPSAVLRRCAADREIVELHRPDKHDGLCNTCGLDGQNLDCTYPCDTLRIMARGYGLEVDGG